MKLILTGHDYAGKSTVLANIWDSVDTGKMSYLHLSYREPTNREFYNHTLEYSNFLMDRCFLDELIYPRVFGRTQNITEQDAVELLKDAYDRGITIAVIYCSEEEIRNRIAKRTNIEEEPEVLEHILLIRSLYIHYANLFGIPLIDSTGKTPEEVKEEVLALIPKKETRKLI